VSPWGRWPETVVRAKWMSACELTTDGYFERNDLSQCYRRIDLKPNRTQDNSNAAQATQ
jgi:hypothetical protein